MFKVQVPVVWNKKWITLAIFPTKEQAEKDVENRSRDALIKFPYRIVEE